MNLENQILRTIHHLRTTRQFVLYANEPKLTNKDFLELESFLELEYENESLNYPFTVPVFDKEAAVWAAKTIYFATQFLIHRNKEPKDLGKYFPPFSGELNPSSILSADLSLRFLSFIKTELEAIDFEDWLLKLLNKITVQFHYSNIGSDLEIKDIDLQNCFNNECYKTLYINRVVDRKDLNLCKIDIINQEVLAQLGNHKTVFWKEL